MLVTELNFFKIRQHLHAVLCFLIMFSFMLLNEHEQSKYFYNCLFFFSTTVWRLLKKKIWIVFYV
jgi:hypothetical protein